MLSLCALAAGALICPPRRAALQCDCLYLPSDRSSRLSSHSPTHFDSDKAFISKGYDATSHFETEIADVLSLYERITGKKADLSRGDPGAAAEAAA